MINIESTAKTVQKAIEAGLQQLGKTIDEVDIRIISAGGLFKKAKVEITILESDKPIKAEKSESFKSTDKAEKSDRVEKSEKNEKSDKPNRNDFFKESARELQKDARNDTLKDLPPATSANAQAKEGSRQSHSLDNRPQSGNKPFEKDKQNFAAKPFSEENIQKPLQKDRDGNSQKSFQKDGYNAAPKPFLKEENTQKPLQKDKEGNSQKPFKKDGYNATPKPFLKEENTQKPFQKDRDGNSQKSFQKGGQNSAPKFKNERQENFDLAGQNNKPFHKDKEEKTEKPFQKEEPNQRKPFTRDGNRDDRKDRSDRTDDSLLGRHGHDDHSGDNLSDRAEKGEREREERHERPRTPITDEITVQAVEFVTNLLKKMDVDFALKQTEKDGELTLGIECDSGALIGYRGETLDSIEYLTSLAVNKSDDKYYRINIDCNDYRSKRVETLTVLAKRMAEKAVKTGRKVVLEPMSSSSRKIIHSVLSENDRIITKSEGKDPTRRIIIIPKRFR